MARNSKTSITIKGYTFVVKPDKTMFALGMPDGRRIMCHGGNPYTDKMFTLFLDRLDRGKVSKILQPLLRKYRIQGDTPILMDCSNSGFKFIQSDVTYQIESISAQIQKLIGLYCSKNKNKNYEEVSEIQDFFRGVI